MRFDDPYALRRAAPIRALELMGIDSPADGCPRCGGRNLRFHRDVLNCPAGVWQADGGRWECTACRELWTPTRSAHF